MKWPSFAHGDLLGVRFALNVFIASAILWYVLRHIADTNPIWAIASMVAAADPQVNEAKRMFRSRIDQRARRLRRRAALPGRRRMRTNGNCRSPWR